MLIFFNQCLLTFFRRGQKLFLSVDHTITENTKCPAEKTVALEY